MTLTQLDRKKYGRLLAEAAPLAIDTEEENERALAIVEKLMAKGENSLSREEDALLELLIQSIETFEGSAYLIGAPTPAEVIEELLAQRELRPTDLWEVSGSKSRVSEILSGKRAISKTQAKKLADFFNVSADIFY